MKNKPGQKKPPLTPNQIKSLHPVVRSELSAGRFTQAQARIANRLVRRPYNFKSRIAVKAVNDKLSRAEIEALKSILNAMPSGAPAALLEKASFAVLRKSRPLDEVVLEVKQAALIFKGMREARAKRPPQ
ncbi:MAG: hypothetical protein COB53_02970 [Elusimicrobia bacterium]|nr:MAG: hypothetical protein COB53_02970 [Elusimicrobiota bacterium]